MKNLIGQTLGGCQVLEELGSGGMGVIYKAKQLSLDRIIAVKVLAEHLAHDATFVQRFQREARAIAKVNHPNILQVYDVSNEADVHYMTMELVEGESLAETLEKRGTLPWQEAAEIVRQAAEGLDAAAQAGIIHRDVKPDNLMITSRGVVKVSDFGLAKEVESSMTATDAVMGTPAYMSPEQCDGKELDGRSDIYSLGGSFYRLVTGRLPFEAETAMSMMYRHKHEPLVPAKEIVPSLPQIISVVISKMMEKRREDRVQTMADVVLAIDQAVKQAPVIDPFKTVTFPGGAQGTAAGMAAALSPEDTARANQLRAEGDERLQRGDIVGAAKLWQEALRLSPRDPDTQERIGRSVRPEVARQKEMGEKMLAGGQLAEAARCFRNARDMDSSDEEVRVRLQILEDKLKVKRTAVNEIRQMISTGRFEEAVAKWDELTPDLREEALEKQVERLKGVTIPAAKMGEQGDSLNEVGRLDEAMELYKKVLAVDESNAKAKQGIKNLEAKLHRLDMMVREGYDYNVRQDYEKAVGAWEQIFKIYPAHPQATKLIVEALFQWGLRVRTKEGGLGKAVECWQRVVELQPDHAEAKENLDSDAAKLAKLNKLNEELSVARRAGREAQAISILRQMQKVAPNDARVAAQLKLSKKRLGRRRLGRLVLILVLGAAGIGMLVAAMEWKLLRDMERFLKSDAVGDYHRAMELYDGNPWKPVIFKRELDDLRRRLRLKYFEAKAVETKDVAQSVELLTQALEAASPDDRPRIERLIAERRYKMAFSDAKAKELEGAWEGAAALYRQASSFAEQAALRDEKTECDTRGTFSTYFDLGLKAQAKGALDEAKGRFMDADASFKGHPAIAAKFLELKIDLELGRKLLAEATAAFKAKNYAEAARLYAQAQPNDRSFGPLDAARLAYSTDNVHCAGLGMELVLPREFRETWGQKERKEAFCVDRFEFPNRMGEVPVTGVTYVQAAAKCAGIGKRLCSAEQWRRACEGPARLTYPYGMDYIKDKCAVEMPGAKKIGADPPCRSDWGVYDMSGNVAEWTTESKKLEEHSLYGGHYSSTAEEAKCASSVSFPDKLPVGLDFMGFRCCSSLPGTE